MASKWLEMLLYLPLMLLAIILIGMGMYNLVIPYIPFGPIGMIVVGIFLLLILGWIGYKKRVV